MHSPDTDDIGGTEARTVPAELWERLRADPVRAPEHIALASARIHGPQAAAWVAKRRAEAAHHPRGLALMARKRHVHLARAGGFVTGFGGFTMMAPDLAAAVWIQSRMVFFIAAAFGYDPLDRMRPAELLVLQNIYDDPHEARAALDGVGKTLAEAYVGRQASRDQTLVSRLLSMAARRGFEKLAGRAIPGVAVVVNSIGNGRLTRQLGDRAITFYGG
ncbi:MAG TPA: EcsC family protein [Solirubrobacteraceae bacterium]